MRKTFLVLGLWIIIAVASRANELDSLLQALPLLGEDTSRVTMLNKIAFRYIFSDQEAAEKYLEEAAALADKIGYVPGKAHALQVRGTLHDVRSEYDKAIACYKKGLAMLDENNVSVGKAHLVLFNGLGLAHYRKGEYAAALEYFLKALKQLENQQMPSLQSGNLLSNIGLVYHDQHELETALDYYSRALAQARALQNHTLIGRTTNNISIIYKEMERYDEAIQYLEESRRSKEITGDSFGMSSVHANLATIYKRQKKYDHALAELQKAMALKEQMGDKLGIIIVNDTKVEVLIAQNRLAEAHKLLQENLRLVQPIGGENKILVYNRFHELYQAKNDYKNALEWYQRMALYKDSLFNETKSKQLADLQARYDLDKKENEILRLEKEQEAAALRANLLWVSLASLALLAIGALWFMRFRMRQKHRLLQVEVELQQQKIENAALREHELQQEIEFKNKELASYTINFVQKSELMEELKKHLQMLAVDSLDSAKKIASINRLVESSYQVDREWEDFKVQFENVHRDFFRLLKERCPELTSGDLKLCALLKLNMNMKEAAKVLGISPESVKTARYRLRKKFGLQQDDNLVDFILGLDREMNAA